MRELTFREAIREALREEMARDDSVFLIGEEIGVNGGAFAVTAGLLQEFGAGRVIDTPISESAIIGCAVGAAVMNTRPIAEIMFADLLVLAMDHIVNSAAKTRYMYGGTSTAPLVVRTAFGAGTRQGLQLSQSPEAWFMHVPGLVVLMPSTPYDAKGLLKTAIRDQNPVIFFEHRLLYSVRGPVPEEEYFIPLGKASIRRTGHDVTLVATAAMVVKSLAAAEKLSELGVSVEVVDPRCLLPLDKETILRSVAKTGRLVIVHEACKTAGMGAEIAALAAEDALGSLDAPVVRVTAPDAPVPFSPVMEDYYVPSEDAIISTIRGMLGMEAS